MLATGVICTLGATVIYYLCRSLVISRMRQAKPPVSLNGQSDDIHALLSANPLTDPFLERIEEHVIELGSDSRVLLWIKLMRVCVALLFVSALLILFSVLLPG
jgi:hypothetical protein